MLVGFISYNFNDFFNDFFRFYEFLSLIIQNKYKFYIENLICFFTSNYLYLFLIYSNLDLEFDLDNN